jgi:hypothetical protein
LVTERPATATASHCTQENSVPDITSDAAPIRTFDTGATRNTDDTKLDFEGFVSPAVLRAFARYMHGHRQQADGSVRSADNWQKGIPLDVYMKSLLRHVMDVWSLHRGEPVTSPETGQPVDEIEALMACMFNVQGMAFEILRQRAENAARIADEHVALLPAPVLATCSLGGNHPANQPHVPQCSSGAARTGVAA